MNNDERDELLIRMDERQQVIHKNIEAITPKVEDNSSDIKSAKSNIRLLKWFGAIVAGLLGYFK